MAGTKYLESAVQRVLQGSEQTALIPYLRTSLPAVRDDATGSASNIINDMGTKEEVGCGY